VAIVSTTTSAKLDIKCARHDVFALIPQDRKLCRDDPRLANYPRLKKPAPDLYLATLSIINQERSSHPANRSVLQPNECLVFEDSVIGVEAARRAGMRVVWVPHPLVRKVLRGLEARVLTGTLEEKERLDPMAAVRGRDKEWELEGMAELRESLAEFDYAKYGISIGSPAGLLPN
jgi:pseudouridine-5'-monophosphatase